MNSTGPLPQDTTEVTLLLSRLDPTVPDALSTRTVSRAEFGDAEGWFLSMTRDDWIKFNRPREITLSVGEEVVHGTVRA